MNTPSSYKGVRDFYPEDERVQKYIFGAMRKTVESFGYEEMNASILESTELYAAKTSEEIVNEQTYTFTDRGERSVTLRPEMTPTVARMVAARRRELGFPLRWYSIQNFFRYERPQKGRGREFWQLNADLFGAKGIEADVEIITIAHRILKQLGAHDADFEIHFSSRKLLDTIYDDIGASPTTRKAVTSLLDRREKMDTGAFNQELIRHLNEKNAARFSEHLHTLTSSLELQELQERLKNQGVQNAIIDIKITRGFEYYTGMVFEVFDTNAENPRSLFGGGRYDTLIEKYGGEAVPAVGFAMGDMVTRDFLETHKLLPALPPVTRLYLAPLNEKNTGSAIQLAENLRKQNIPVALGMGHEKIADHIKAALKLNIPYFALYGDEEESSGIIAIKKLATNAEEKMTCAAMSSYLGSITESL